MVIFSGYFDIKLMRCTDDSGFSFVEYAAIQFINTFSNCTRLNGSLNFR